MQDAEEFCIEEDVDDEQKKSRPIIKNAMDLQRLKLEKLMKNPEKPIIIPEPHREKDFMQSVPTFVRNVMGSSAGAGSGEFHVYRHLRRKEYARQKFIQAKSIREQLDDDYRQKLEQNRLNSEAKTAKRRAKRLKKKQKMKRKGKKPRKECDENSKNDQKLSESSSSEEESEVDERIQDEEKQVQDQEKNIVSTELKLNDADSKSSEGESSHASFSEDGGSGEPKLSCDNLIKPLIATVDSKIPLADDGVSDKGKTDSSNEEKQVQVQEGNKVSTELKLNDADSKSSEGESSHASFSEDGGSGEPKLSCDNFIKPLIATVDSKIPLADDGVSDKGKTEVKEVKDVVNLNT